MRRSPRIASKPTAASPASRKRARAVEPAVGGLHSSFVSLLAPSGLALELLCLGPVSLRALRAVSRADRAAVEAVYQRMCANAGLATTGFMAWWQCPPASYTVVMSVLPGGMRRDEHVTVARVADVAEVLRMEFAVCFNVMVYLVGMDCVLEIRHSSGASETVPLLSLIKLSVGGQPLWFEDAQVVENPELEQLDEEVCADGTLRLRLSAVSSSYTVCAGPLYRCWSCKEHTLCCECWHDLDWNSSPFSITMVADLTSLPPLRGRPISPLDENYGFIDYEMDGERRQDWQVAKLEGLS